MSRNFVVLTGQKIGKLLVIGEPIRENKITRYKCICDCGNETVVSQGALNTKDLRNATRSCGCKKFTHIDISGLKFGKLTVVHQMPQKTKDKRHLYMCKCTCGETLIVDSRDLKNKVDSCICRTKHKGLSGANRNLYSVWKNMNDRCFNKKDKKYKSYGERGISVCYRWSAKNKNGFKNFVEDFGDKYKPNSKLSFDRINNNKSYSPKNVRLADNKTQSNNRRDNRKIILSGRIISLMEFSNQLNKPYNTIRSILLKRTPNNLIKYYYERGKIDRETYERTKDAVWTMGSKNYKRKINTL